MQRKHGRGVEFRFSSQTASRVDISPISMPLAIVRERRTITLSFQGVLQPPPGGLWGMPADQIATLPGYDPDVHKSREEARRLMQKIGYSADHRLGIKVTTRDWSAYRDPAVLLIDQLKHIYIDGELELVDTAQYFPKIQRKDFTVALNFQTAGPDPDPVIHLFYGCGSSLNWDGYCRPELDKLIEEQSREGDIDPRKQLLRTIEKKLADDNVRSIIFYRPGGTGRRPPE